MAVKTSNKYGKITVSDEAVAMIAGHAAAECYGVVELVSRKFTDSLASIFKQNSNTKGIRVTSEDNKIYIDVFAILKQGVLVDAVSESLRSVITYSVETFTGMRVMQVNVNVVGIKV